jgi:hypothetical protein
VAPPQAPGQPAAPARYLNGALVTVIATDYGGYAVTFAVSQLSLQVGAQPQGAHLAGGHLAVMFVPLRRHLLRPAAACPQPRPRRHVTSPCR